MSLTVLANSLGISHKGSNGFSVCTLPDVCKTPTPGGPVPTPYPNFAESGSLTGGTTTVKLDGGNMAAHKPSEYAMSTGDEPGTLGGVTSSTFKKQTNWITCSLDVRFEGQGVCRLTDKQFHNNKNTVNCAGDFELAAIAAALKAIAQACDEAVNKAWDDAHPKGPKHNNCYGSSGGTMYDSKTGNMVDKPVQVKLGELKEDCVQANTPPNDYMKWQQDFDAAGQPCSGPSRGGARPDILIVGPGGLKDIQAVMDLKFPCPSEAKKPGRWREGQQEKYRRLFKVEPTLVFP